MLSSLLYRAQKNDRHHAEEEIRACVINILQKPGRADAGQDFAALFRWVPSGVAFLKNLHVDPDSRSKRETCGVIIQERGFFLFHLNISFFISAFLLDILYADGVIFS